MNAPLITKQGLRRVDYPACTANACGQNSRRCRTPEACHVPADDIDPSKPNVLASALKYGIAALLLVAAAAAPLFLD